ncbi:MAG: hypothetical protein PHU71_00185 [Candidatus Gracilibacteria bacterium]|nr:hypothetical protein [Candidatus Gracilibacteria bacterium]
MSQKTLPRETQLELAQKVLENGGSVVFTVTTKDGGQKKVRLTKK